MSAATVRHSRYSSVAIGFHWVVGLLIIGNLIGGLLMGNLLDSADPAMKQLGFQVIQIHKSIGLTVLALSIARLGWRLTHPVPPLPDHMTTAERLLARGTHIGFYALMLLMPLSGWAMASTGKVQFPILWFGLFEVPHLPLDKALGGLFKESHELLGWVTIATLALHIAGALKHHFLDRDDVLARMLPLVRPRR